MKALNFILPGTSSTLSAENETPGFHPPSPKPTEPFNALMLRALARPARARGESFYAARKSPGDLRSSRVSTNAAGAARKPGPASHPKAPAGAALSPATLDPSPAFKDAEGGLKIADGGSIPDPPSSLLAAASDSASGDAATALQTLASSEAVQINLTAAVAIGASKIPGPGAGNNPGAPGGTTQVANSKNDGVASESVKGVAEKMSKPGANEPAEKRQEVSAAAGDPAKKTGSAGGAAPLQALLGKAGISQEPPAMAANSGAGKPLFPASEAAGISAAQQDATMNNTDNAPKIAGDPERSLPGVTVVAAAPLPAREPAAFSKAEDGGLKIADGSSILHPPSSLLAAASESASSNLISASAQTDLRVRALDRTHDLMALHGMRLKESNADSLQVVLKPGAGIELSLQLKQTGDGIQAHAVLQRGDFNQLNQHWTELQQRLEERGIKLAPLGHENSAASNGHENSQRHFKDEDGGWKIEDGNSILPPPASILAAAHDSLLPPRGWESWA